MAEEGDVLAEGSALVEREEDLDELRRSTAALTKMMQTVLQRIDDGVGPGGNQWPRCWPGGVLCVRHHIR